MTDDEDIVFILAVPFRARSRLTVRMRGPEHRLVFEFKDKRTRRVVGLREVKDRIND